MREVEQPAGAPAGAGRCGANAGEVVVAASQMEVTDDVDAMLAKAEKVVRDAARGGAQIVLLQELFAGHYFPQEQDPRHYRRAEPLAESRVVRRMQALAAELEVVLPVSFFEKAGKAYFNSIAMIDADGSVLGVYRKTHIPDGPGYQEKFYFSPGDSGFRVFETRYGRVGAAICWDQWFPETARSLALMGADLLFFPTAIDSEPQDPQLDSRHHWRRVMQGHAAANMVPVVASNRIGREAWPSSRPPSDITFYGNSFIADETGDIVAKMGAEEEGFVLACFDLGAIDATRSAWGLFRDRRPEHYGAIATMDGRPRA